MKKFDVLITDHIADEGIEILEKAESINYEIRAGISNADLKPILGNYDAVITRSGTTVDADLLENTGKLKIVGRAGVGLDNVDIETASKKGLIVMNAPTGNTHAAVELTMGMILAACRKIPTANQSVKSDEWNRKKFMGIQLLNKTLGIVGIGRIGGNVVTRCKAFGMKVLAYDPYVKQSRAETLGVTLCESLDEVLSQADVITLHTPLTEETKGMISKKQFDIMKDGAVFQSLTQFLLKMEQTLDTMNLPQSFTAVRAFAPPPPTNAVISPTLKQQEGALATFALRIIFRQNSSWQGSITWLEAGREQSFRSVLELIFLMDSALSGQESAIKSS